LNKDEASNQNDSNIQDQSSIPDDSEDVDDVDDDFDQPDDFLIVPANDLDKDSMHIKIVTDDEMQQRRSE